MYFDVLEALGELTMPKKGYVLAVDDTVHNVELLADMLKANGYEVGTQTDSRAVLAAVQQHRPDLILLDIMMPHLDGFALCRRLKADPDTATIPVIFISALHDTSNIMKGFEAGAADYITKPFKLQEVLARVASQITLSQQYAELQAQHQQRVHYFETLAKMRQQFIHGATHDLKNPLHIVLGYAGLLEGMSGPEFEANGAELVAGIIAGAQKMQLLIDEMLDLAQLETGRTVLELSEVSVEMVVQHVVDSYQTMAAQKGQTLTAATDGVDAKLFMDINRLVRALENLVSNAIKYTPAGGAIEIGATLGPDEVVIYVQDNGLGIPEAQMANLFEPFFRVNTTAHRSQDGTGLGLSIVKTIIEQHGGQITVTSVEGQGSIFRLHIPHHDYGE